MCGRYVVFTDKDSAEILKIIDEVEKNTAKQVKTGEIFPTDTAPVLFGQGRFVVSGAFPWGFPNMQGKGVIINARAETAFEKRLFRESLFKRRCALPASGFFEWTHEGEKQKYLFRLPDAPVLYMAGLYGDFGGQQRFVILTTAANSSLAGVHDRMPLVLAQGEKEEWLLDAALTDSFLHRLPPVLSRAAVG